MSGGGKGTEKLKRTLHQPWRRMWGSISWPGDHSLSWNGESDAPPTGPPRRPYWSVILLNVFMKFGFVVPFVPVCATFWFEFQFQACPEMGLATGGLKFPWLWGGILCLWRLPDIVTPSSVDFCFSQVGFSHEDPWQPYCSFQKSLKQIQNSWKQLHAEEGEKLFQWVNQTWVWLAHACLVETVSWELGYNNNS